MTLEAYLRDAARVPFDRETANCGHLVGGWVALRRGVDPAATARGRYAEGDELVSLAERLAAEHGLAEVPADEAKAGDVGLVGGARPFLAVATGAGRWAARFEGGLWLGRARIRKAWSV